MIPARHVRTAPQPPRGLQPCLRASGLPVAHLRPAFRGAPRARALLWRSSRLLAHSRARGPLTRYARSRQPGAQAASWHARARGRLLAADQDAHRPPSQVARPVPARRRARISEELLLDLDGKGIDLGRMSPPRPWWD
ncbi:hypothetical protein C2845_PM07G08920 [Panicum miliaceum]|uniref:Uncharacterized protein n=1 Tax=Panicum miliaceum TaxID=4540 RepID=A0A3L6SPN7_PANMI|nr:hypothetical protein C2845_PM07G08920 [Panicum miliaceum]